MDQWCPELSLSISQDPAEGVAMGSAAMAGPCMVGPCHDKPWLLVTGPQVDHGQLNIQSNAYLMVE